MRYLLLAISIVALLLFVVMHPVDVWLQRAEGRFALCYHAGIQFMRFTSDLTTTFCYRDGVWWTRKS